MRTLLIICVVFAFRYTYSEACSCLPRHPQVQFCNADFVIRAKILERKQTGNTQLDDVIYTVKMIEDYKMRSYQRGREIKIFTAFNDGLCGSYFSIGSEYVITGSIRNNKWTTNLCSWNLQTSSLTSYQRDALKFGYYKNSCSCDVKVCFEGQCPQPTPRRCVVDQFADFTCLSRENSCRQETFGCAWHSPACF